mgnify:CR=1 FL=1
MSKVVSIDLGASNGRLILLTYENDHLYVEEVHRFTNEPIYQNNRLHWNISYILNEIKIGLKKYQERYEEPLNSIGVDTWGVDFGLINTENELVQNPYSYRDIHTLSIMKEVYKKIEKKQLFQRTGVELININSIYQLYTIYKNEPELLQETEVILTMPSLVNFLLTGEKFNEFTHASTTQLFNWKEGNWDRYLMKEAFGEPLPLAQLKATNSIYGYLKQEFKEELKLSQVIPIINVPGHDTACAVAAMPKARESAYMSCGTWVLIGVEVDEPIVSDHAYKWGFTNEGTAENKYRVQKNNMGLWLLQQCRKEWAEEGTSITYEEEKKLIRQAPPFQSFIDPDNEMFFNPQSMTKSIKSFCQKTGQPIPSTKGELMRCILESLALKYRWVIEKLEQLTRQTIPEIHMAGGGIRNELFCQFTANATNKPIKTGPVEASAIGNGLCQLVTLKEIADLENARKVVQQSFSINEYIPNNVLQWEENYNKFSQYLTWRD